MPWPDSMILGILGRRTDEETLRWALELAGRWSTDLLVVTSYRPPVGMFPHIVTEGEIRRCRDHVRADATARIATALGGGGPAPRRTSVEVVPESQLERRLITGSREVDLLVLVTAPAVVTFVARRRRSRAERVGLAAECPTSVGPGMAVRA